MLDSSREGHRSSPCAFQLGGRAALEAWQRAAATMRCGEVAWVRSSAKFAFGALGAMPLVPANATLWFQLEIVNIRHPGTVQFFKDFGLAIEEAERQLEVGRGDVQRKAFGQARQAFRRALNAVPDKLLLRRPVEDVARFADMERSALLNQALCSLRLGEEAQAQEQQHGGAEHWQDVVRVCTLLLERHLGARSAASPSEEGVGPWQQQTPTDTSMISACLQAASGAAGPATWAAKAFFRRATAREHLGYVSDAVGDLSAARRLAPGDAGVAEKLEALRRRQRQSELKPSAMFAGILERELAEREREEQARSLQEKKRRREERLQRQSASAA
mmetsp:Transcript_150382/g.481277  ORF Transcript_150382/g.481277 Transcript_150382/m.481277 type:complete len:332 (+) Transcript_150382:2678-3673(+)